MRLNLENLVHVVVPFRPYDSVIYFQRSLSVSFTLF